MVLKNIWEMHREALGIYKAVFEHMGMLGHQGVSECMGHPNIGGCPDTPKHMGTVNTMSPKCKTYMPIKKIRGV